MSIERLPGAGDNVAELVSADWFGMQGFNNLDDQSPTPAELVEGASYWFTFSRPRWKLPRSIAASDNDKPIALLITFLDSFLAGGTEADLAGIVVKKTADSDVYEIEFGDGIKVDVNKDRIESTAPSQAVCLDADKNGGVVVRVVTDRDDDDYFGMKECTWEFTTSGITELTESGRKGRHHPTHGSWSFHCCDKFESYHRVRNYSPVYLSDGSEVIFATGRVMVVCDGRRIQLDYGNNLLAIHDTNGVRWEHPRPTVTGKNGEVLQLHGVEQVYGRVTVNWTVNDLKIETRNGGMIEVENILGERGSIYFEKRKS